MLTLIALQGGATLIRNKYSVPAFSWYVFLSLPCERSLEKGRKVSKEVIAGAGNNARFVNNYQFVKLN